jgi:hypothetical protein
MVDASGSWRHLYDLARNEPDPHKQKQLCQEARAMLQDHLLKLTAQDSAERQALESALRDLWKIENKT